MKRLTVTNRIKALLLILFAAGVGYAKITGPDAGYTNAPGDIGNCVLCHDTFHEANVGPGGVTINGVPAVYNPNQQYTLNVTVQQASRSRFGFQLTAISANGDRAGTLTTLDGNTQVNPLTGAGLRQYIQHTQSGSLSPVVGSRTFNVRWTAPATDVGAVRFFFTGNAANNDGTNQNDYIYANAALAESETTVVNVSLLTDPAGLTFEPGGSFELTWDVTNKSNVEAYDIRYSTDDGATFPITNQILSSTDPDLNGVEWTIPNKPASKARVRIETITKSGSSVKTMSGAFEISGGADQSGLPVITGAETIKKKLVVYGVNFQKGAKVELNGVQIKTKNMADFEHQLKCKKAAKLIVPGSTVGLVVRNPDGSVSAEFLFTRPEQ